MKKRTRKILILLIGSYLLIWVMTWGIGMKSVEKDCERRYVNLASVSAYSPCPFIVNIDFEYDHPLGCGEMNSWYLWAFGYCMEFHEKPGVHGMKI